MAEDQREREYQFETANVAGVEHWIRSQPQHARLRFLPGTEKTQHDTYMDTADWALYRGGYTLRIRRKGETSEATMKARGKRSAGPQDRREINQSLANAAEGLQQEVGSVSRRVSLMTGGKAVSQLFEVETRRLPVIIDRDGVRLAEISLDSARVLLGGDERRSFERVEVEEVASGGLDDVASFIEAMRRACNLTPAQRSKFDEGLDAAGLNPDAAFDLGYAVLSADATAGEYAYAILRGYFLDFLNHEPGTRLGEDPEELHDMRVAARKLRAAMSTFRPVLALRFGPLRDELRWVAQCLGEVRDLDVQIEWLEGVQQASSWEEATALGPLIEGRREHRDIERTRLLEALDSERYQALVRDMTNALREGDQGQGDAMLPIRQFGRKVLRRRHRQFEKDADILDGDSEPAHFHAVRIRAKRLRYTADALSEVFGPRTNIFIASLKGVQDLLGEYQDSSVAIGWLREAALADPQWPAFTFVRTGELIEQRRQRMVDLGREWPRARESVEKAWPPLRRAARKASRSPDAKKGDHEEDHEPAIIAVQRPLSLFQRFFRRG